MNAHGRLLDQDWFHILMRLKSSIVKCPQCGAEIFLESTRETICGNHKVQPVGYLNFDKRSNRLVTVPIFKGAVLYNYHVDNSEDFKNVAALIKEKNGKFGLENKTNRSWTITAPDGKMATRQPGEIAVLGANFTINFGGGNTAQVILN